MERYLVIDGLKRILMDNEVTDTEKEVIEGAIELIEGKRHTPRLLDDGFYCAVCGRCLGDPYSAGDADYCPDCGSPVDWEV